MMRILIVLIPFLVTMISTKVWSKEGSEDCKCPIVRCGPCQKKVSVGKIVKFCDWGDINVCSKLICENVPYFFKCLAENKRNRTQKKSDDGNNKDIELLYEVGNPVDWKKNKKRKLSSVKKKGPRHGCILHRSVSLFE